MEDSNRLFNNLKQFNIFLLSLILIFLINLSYGYFKFLKFNSLEINNTTATVENIYPKQNYYILKLSSNDYSFYTSIYENSQNIQQLDRVDIDFITKNISFIDYIRGFYSKSININKIDTSNSHISNISKYISSQHQDENISQLFNALFLALPISKELRDHCVDFGVSHLIALSGFHLGVLAFIVYWIFYFPYSYIHQKYFPYRNKKYDILLLSSLFLFSYLLFLGLIPSLLRAFVMYVFAIFLYRNNIKILSYGTLVIILLMIIAFLPKLLFSISLWLSIFGVFYIFLFLQYFSKLNKVIQFLLFNIWLFLALNPIIYQIFNTASYHQIYSALFTIGFSLFYPIELFLHIINQGDLLDPIIRLWLNIKAQLFQTSTSVYFTAYYLILSLLSTKFKEIFWLLNLSFIGFFVYIFI